MNGHTHLDSLEKSLESLLSPNRLTCVQHISILNWPVFGRTHLFVILHPYFASFGLEIDFFLGVCIHCFDFIDEHIAYSYLLALIAYTILSVKFSFDHIKWGRWN